MDTRSGYDTAALEIFGFIMIGTGLGLMYGLNGVEFRSSGGISIFKARATLLGLNYG